MFPAVPDAPYYLQTRAKLLDRHVVNEANNSLSQSHIPLSAFDHAQVCLPVESRLTLCPKTWAYLVLNAVV